MSTAVAAGERPASAWIGARDGITLGAAWALAELLTALGSGGEFFWRFSAFLGAYWLAGLTLGGAVGSLVEGRLFRGLRPHTRPGLWPHLVVFGYVVLVLNGSSMAGQGMGVRGACGVAALALTLLGMGLARPSRTGWTLAILAAVLGGYFGGLAAGPAGSLARGAAVLACTFGPVLLAGALSRVTGEDDRPGGSLGYVVALAVPALVLVVMQSRIPRDPQSYVAHAAPSVPAPTAVSAAAPPPNIVLIVLDTVRAANLSCYGYKRATTPNLDRFAADAVRYSHYTAVAAWTLPGHASLFTGLYPSRHGAHDPGVGETREGKLEEGFDTLAERLARRGYATGGIVSNFGATSRAYGLDQGFQDYDSLPSRSLLRFDYAPLLYGLRYRLPYPLLLHPLERLFPTPYRTAPEITDKATRWVANVPAGKPYFLFVNYMEAHSPFTPLEARSAECGEPPRRFPRGGLSPKADREIMGGQRPISADESAHLTCLYDARLSFLDRQVGALLAFLAARPEYDNTWVFITSDHGESLGEHGHLYHGSTLGEEILRIPLLARYPRSGPEDRGRVDDRPAQQVDIVPTVMEALGEPEDRFLDGISLRRRREAMMAEAFTFTYHSRQFPELYRKETKSITVGGLKYVEDTKGAKALYDVSRDPGEEQNLLTVSPDAAARLVASLDEWKARMEAGKPAAGKGPTQEQRDRLKALGYVE